MYRLLLCLTLATTLLAQDELNPRPAASPRPPSESTATSIPSSACSSAVSICPNPPPPATSIFPALRDSGMRAPFFALWCPVYYKGSEAVRRTLQLRDAMQEVLDRNKNAIEARDPPPPTSSASSKPTRSRHF